MVLERIDRAENIVERAGIRVSAGLAQECTRREQPGAGDATGVDRLGQPEDVAARIARRGEALVQIADHVMGGHGSHRHLVEVLAAIQHAVLKAEVRMHVDQAGHHRAPAPIDHRGARSLNRAGRDGPDEVTDHQDVHALGEAIVGAVEDVDVGEQDLRRLWLLSGGQPGEKGCGEGELVHWVLRVDGVILSHRGPVMIS